MDEKTKNILSYVLSIMIVGSIITSFAIDPYNSTIGLLYILGAILGLCFLGYWVARVRDLLYEFFSSSYFQKVYHKYISKHYESRRQVFYERGNEICSKCDADCMLKRPFRRYEEDSYCKNRVDLYIEEYGLKVDELIGGGAYDVTKALDAHRVRRSKKFI